MLTVTPRVAPYTTTIVSQMPIFNIYVIRNTSGFSVRYMPAVHQAAYWHSPVEVCLWRLLGAIDHGTLHCLCMFVGREPVPIHPMKAISRVVVRILWLSYFATSHRPPRWPSICSKVPASVTQYMQKGVRLGDLVYVVRCPPRWPSCKVSASVTQLQGVRLGDPLYAERWPSSKVSASVT